MRVSLILIATALATPALPQGFAGLGTEAEGFALPDPAYRLTFPLDHGPHEGFRIEWWYLTANMTGPDGTPYGLQWTLFRSALTPEGGSGWSTPAAWLGHAAVTTPDTHYATERWARAGIGQAGVTASDERALNAWIDDWTLSGDTLNDLTLSASGPEFRYTATLSDPSAPILHGANSYSVKSRDGQASHYYSVLFDLNGTLTLPQGDIPVTGTAWMDREWSSQPLSETQTGWDWFSLSFDSGARMMGFVLRDASGDFTSGTWIEPDGTTTPITGLTATPKRWSDTTGARVPITWHLTLPDRGLDITVAALNPQAWMPLSTAYWEGPVIIEGSHNGTGYLEMTGYGAD